MIDRARDLPVAWPAIPSSVAGAINDLLPAASEAELPRRIDELHQEPPFAGNRMLRDMLKPMLLDGSGPVIMNALI